MKLISMTDFVLNEQKETSIKEMDLSFSDRSLKKLSRIYRYANFLKQPLKLEMFVPCDEEGNVLEEPTEDIKNEFGSGYASNQEKQLLDDLIEEWEQAKEKVLFEGFTIDDFEIDKSGVMLNSKKWQSVWMIEGRTVEEMVYTHATLTPSAIKLLGL